jgi:hypothetical protein
MKTLLINVLLFLVTVLVFSCKEKITEPDENYSVSGTIVYNNSVLPNAQVSLNKIANYSAVTDTAGKFVISNVPKGDYQLSISKNLTDGSSTEINKQIAVASNVTFSELLLPKAIHLDSIKNVTSSSITLRWSPTDANDFREYKVYRHTTPGLDETTGTLVYVATSISDTSFVDTELFESTQYYYRVYVMNEFGKLGGSNISSTKTLFKNLILNGDFESYDSFHRPTDWLTENNVFFVSDSNHQSGRHALKGMRNSYLVELGPQASLRQYIPYTSVVAGKRYVFSFYYLVQNLPGNATLKVSLGTDIQLGANTPTSVFINGSSVGTWQNYTFTFTAPPLTQDLNVSCYVQTNIPNGGEPWDVWLDNFELKRAD